MSTTALTGLRDYLTETLSTSNMLWLSTQLAEYAKKHEEPLKPYTKEELLERAESARKRIAEGHYTTIENVLEELDEEFVGEELQMETV